MGEIAIRADRFGERYGKFAVSVSIQNRRKQISRTNLSPSPISGEAAGSRNPAQLPILSAQRPFPQDCGGCGEMHYGIAKFITENGGTDEEVAEACGVTLAIVRQAKGNRAISALVAAVACPSACSSEPS